MEDTLEQAIQDCRKVMSEQSEQITGIVFRRSWGGYGFRFDPKGEHSEGDVIEFDEIYFGKIEKVIRPRLFSGVYPEGIVYADRFNEEYGDYKRLGFLAFKDLSLDLEPDCPEHLKQVIREGAAKIQKRRGEEFQTSETGQTITLGWALKREDAEL